LQQNGSANNNCPTPSETDAFQPVGICVLTTEFGGHGHVQVTSTVTHSHLVDFNTPAGPQRMGIARPGGGQEFLRATMPTDICEAAAELTQLRMVMQGEEIQSLPMYTYIYTYMYTYIH